jgi:hypothetical protein
MPNVNGQDFPYTKEGMAAAAKAKKSSGSMSNEQMAKKSGMNDVAQKRQAAVSKVDAMKSALKRAASAAKKTPAGSVAAGLEYKLPARIGDTGTKSNMPATKSEPLKKKNLAQ